MPHLQVGSSRDAAVADEGWLAWLRFAKPRALSCPHAEEPRSRKSRAPPHAWLRCAASRSMRARAAPSFETRAAPAPQDEAAQRIPSALAARRRTVRRNPISRFQTAHIYSFPRRISASGVCDFASPAPKRGVGGAPRNVRVRARHPWGVSCASQTRVNALMTRYARRLRGALRPVTRDARLSALHRGDSLFRSFPRKRESSI